VSNWPSRSCETTRPTAVWLFGIAAFFTACGVVGAPIPPEDVGVTPTITRQKLQHAREEQKPVAVPAEEATQDVTATTLQGQDVELPPLRPVGTR
jgi:hypothetical protein